jgi:hypothetical protein
MDFTGFRTAAIVVAVLFVAAGVVSAVGISNRQCDFDRISPEAAAQYHDRVTPPPTLTASD